MRFFFVGYICFPFWFRGLDLVSDCFSSRSLNIFFFYISEQNIQDFLMEPARRAFLKDLYSGHYTVKLAERPKDAEAMASFRKLNVK